MATRTTMAMGALILLGLLVLLPCASVAEEQVGMEALIAHLREIQQISNPELAKFNAKGAEDLVAAPGAGAESSEAAVDAEEVAVEGSAFSDLMAHIDEVRRKAHEENEANAANASEEDKEVAEEEDKEDEKDVDQDGVVADSLAQESFKNLDTLLKTLTDNAVNNQDELGEHQVQLSAKGAKKDDVINLLHKYAMDMQQRLNAKGAGRAEDDQSSHHAAVESDPEHGKHHEDHLHSHGHGHDHDHDHDHIHDHDNEQQRHGRGHGHRHEDGHRHHHDHAHGDAHANVGFSRVSDAHYHNHDHVDHSQGHDHGDSINKKKFMLPEEIAEEEDLLQYGFEGQVYSSAEQPTRLTRPDTGVWLRAMGCSLLVSLASLICLMILPCIVSKGKPSETVVNALAAFGGGAMLGDAFLHQLPHAFGHSGPPHSHDAHQHHDDHGHSHSHSHDHDHSSATGQGHGHSLQDLSVGLAVLGGILLFFIVEKIVRRYEELSSHGGQRALGHSHHHHQKRKDKVNKLEGPEKDAAVGEVAALEDKESKSLESKSSDLKKRKGGKKKDIAALENETSSAPTQSPQQLEEASGGFVIGYLNLFSDGVHNFTDGMALGSAFLLHGTVGGWSRTLFLLAHELPQEVGDFGILVKSGFSVFEALAFNFLSALVALAGTAAALIFGASAGNSSLMEGFIAGGFIYMSVGGVMPSMHDQGSSFFSTLSQLVPMVLGMGVAVAISLAE